MIKTIVTYKNLKLLYEVDELILVASVDPLFGHWVPRIAIEQIEWNEDGTINLSIFGWFAGELTFLKE